MGLVGDGPEQRCREAAVEHRGLVDHDHIGRQGVVGSVGETARGGVELEQTVKGARTPACRLGHTLGCSPGWCGEYDSAALGSEDVAKRPQDGRLTRAGSAC